MCDNRGLPGYPALPERRQDFTLSAPAAGNSATHASPPGSSEGDLEEEPASEQLARAGPAAEAKEMALPPSPADGQSGNQGPEQGMPTVSCWGQGTPILMGWLSLDLARWSLTGPAPGRGMGVREVGVMGATCKERETLFQPSGK